MSIFVSFTGSQLFCYHDVKYLCILSKGRWSKGTIVFWCQISSHFYWLHSNKILSIQQGYPRSGSSVGRPRATSIHSPGGLTEWNWNTVHSSPKDRQLKKWCDSFETECIKMYSFQRSLTFRYWAVRIVLQIAPFPINYRITSHQTGYCKESNFKDSNFLPSVEYQGSTKTWNGNLSMIFHFCHRKLFHLK